MNDNTNTSIKKDFDFQDSILLDWERWSKRYFPVEKNINNWEKELVWVLNEYNNR